MFDDDDVYDDDGCSAETYESSDGATYDEGDYCETFLG